MSACRASSRAAPLIRGAPARSRPRRRVARAAQGPLPEALAAAPQLHQQPAVGEIASIGADIAPAAEAVLGPFFAIMSVAFITRIVMSWDPNIKDETMPWLFAVLPTEPIMAPLRKAVPPVGGVDVSPIIGVAVVSFLNEILLGPQGILKLLQR